MEAVVREAVVRDVGAILALWTAADAEPTHTDDPDGLEILLRFDPGALLVAEVDGELAGSVIAAWDGWRGSVYRLVVHPDHRRLGLAGQLLRRAEERLERLGARRLAAVVVESDSRAIGFWSSTSWTQQAERARFVRG